MPSSDDLNALGVLPANIQNGAGLGIHHMRPQPMAEDFGLRICSFENGSVTRP